MECLPRSEYRIKNQINDAARSTVANFEEGWKRATTREYLTFLGYTQGSLEEVRGDVERLFQDKFLRSVPGSKLVDLGIDLKTWNEYCKNPVNSSRILSFPLITGEDITYEILIELINKTDYLLRKLVISLEGKLMEDKKYYQFERSRIRGRLT